MPIAIPRYLADPEQGVSLRNGVSVRVRAIRPDDEPRLMALCRRLSPRTVYDRFFSFRRLLPEEAHAFANVDYHRQMAVVAEVDDGQELELVGVARYGPSDEGTAGSAPTC
jgi:acetyltransferase